MTSQDYLSQRLDHQINWYETKSASFQKRYKLLKTIIIALSVSIPFFVGLISDDTTWLKIAVGLAGVIVALSEGLLSMNNYQEFWIQYRATAEALRREKLLYLTKAGPYQQSTQLALLVARVEGIMGQEQQSWVAQQLADDDQNEKNKVPK